MPPEILTAALRYKADLAARESVAMRSMANRWLQVTRGLEGEIDALARIMAARRASGLPVTAGYLYRTERYQQLLQQAYGQFIRYEDFAADLIARNTATFARLGREYGLGLLDVLEPGIGGGFNRFSVGAIENIAGFVERGPLRALLADAWPQAIEQTTSALVRGVALGYGPRKIAAEMVRGMNAGLQRALVISRTESMRSFRQSTLDTWRAVPGVKSYVRICARDRRTCAGCMAADSREYPIEVDFQSHPQCRCTMIVRMRNGTPEHFQSGEEWFTEQPPSTQRSILGPGKYALWSSGQVDFAEFASIRHNHTWGDSIVPATIRELTR